MAIDRKSILLRLGFGVLAADLLLLCIPLLGLASRLEVNEAREQVSILSTADILVNTVETTIDKIDFCLITLEDGLENDIAMGRGINETRTMSVFARYEALLPGTMSLSVVMPDGSLRFARETPIKPLSASDQDYFRELRDDRHAGLAIGEVALDASSETKSIVFARRLKGPDASFAGVVQCTIDPEYFARQFALADSRALGLFALFGLDGHLFLSYPIPGENSKSLIDIIGSRRLAEALAENKKDSVYVSPARMPNNRWILGFSRSEKYPFAVAALRRGDDYLGNWKEMIALSAILLAVSFAFTYGLAFLYYSSWKRRRLFLEELMKEKATAQGYLDIANVMLGVLDSDDRIRLLNRRGCELLGYEEKEILGRKWFDTVVPPEEAETRKSLAWFNLNDKRDYYDAPESRIVLKDGSERYISFHISALRGASGELTGCLFSGEDVTEILRSRERERSSHEVLELIASGAGLPAILSFIAATFESTGHSDFCSIRIFDEKARRLSRGAAPSLPESFLSIIDRSELVESETSLQAELLSGRTVIVDDLQSHPFWAQAKEAAASVGLVSAWVKPVMGEGGELIASIAIYRKKRGRPTEDDLKRTDNASDTIRLAIEKRQALESLKESESRYRSIFELSAVSLWEEDITELRTMLGGLRSQGIVDLGSYLDDNPSFIVSAVESMRVVDVNEATLKLYGASSKAELGRSLWYPLEKVIIEGFRETLIAIFEGRHYLSFPSTTSAIDGRRLDILVFIYIPAEASPLQSILVSVFDITETVRASRDLETAVKEKEVLLKELQHRVKNTLVIVASLMDLDEARVEDPKAKDAFREAQGRILAMSAVYERLYRFDELGAVDLEAYLSELVNSIVSSYSSHEGKIRLIYNLSRVKIDVKRAISLGLIINELVTNVLKYAYPGETEGSLEIDLLSVESSIVLRVMDEGVGMPENFSPTTSESFGTKLVDLLVGQIDAAINYLPGKGTRIEIRFPERE